MKKEILLADGRTATVSFLAAKDDVGELRGFINAFVDEKAYILADRKFTLKQEAAWKQDTLASQRKGGKYVLVARIGGKIAGTTEGRREPFKARSNVTLGLAIAKPYRRIGLGEALLRLNIETAKKMMKPKTIWLSILAPNKPARALYHKVGFREFAVFPKWLLHDGKYVDHVFMRLPPRKPTISI
jgi:RimJ/RimL family protein N-acetyltransferase